MIMVIIRFNQVSGYEMRSLLSFPKPQIVALTGPIVQNEIVGKIKISGYLIMRIKVFLIPREIKSIVIA